MVSGRLADLPRPMVSEDTTPVITLTYDGEVDRFRRGVGDLDKVKILDSVSFTASEGFVEGEGRELVDMLFEQRGMMSSLFPENDVIPEEYKLIEDIDDFISRVESEPILTAEALGEEEDFVKVEGNNIIVHLPVADLHPAFLKPMANEINRRNREFDGFLPSSMVVECVSIEEIKGRRFARGPFGAPRPFAETQSEAAIAMTTTDATIDPDDLKRNVIDLVASELGKITAEAIEFAQDMSDFSSRGFATTEELPTDATTERIIIIFPVDGFRPAAVGDVGRVLEEETNFANISMVCRV